MSSKTMKNAVALAAGALGVAGAVAIATPNPLWAAPVASNTAAAASNQVTDVQYRRRGYYGRGYGRGYYGRSYYGRGYYRRGYGYPYGGYGYPYGGYAYPYYYPYAYPSPYLGFGFGWGGW
jgi:hypothetical protein